MEVNMDKIVI